MLVFNDHRTDMVPLVPVDLRPLPKEPEPDKKKTLKVGTEFYRVFQTFL